MNTKFKNVALAIVFGMATTSLQAQEANATVVETPHYIAKMITTPNSTELKVMVGNIANEKLFLTMKDANGNALYTRKIAKNEPQAYIKLNMDQLPDGVYSVEMADKNGRSTKSFRKGTEVIVSRPIETLVALK
jgi:hypothetical protein